MKIQVKRTSEHTLPLPTYATCGAAAVDLRACLLNGHVTITPGSEHMISTGFAFALPESAAMIVLPRSGLGARDGIVLGNLVGLIDPDYRGPVKIALWYRKEEGPDITIKHGDRICQAMILPVLRPEFVEVDELPGTDRGAGGFGSTGGK
jgi:dUTP pyrophosphatase